MCALVSVVFAAAVVVVVAVVMTTLKCSKSLLGSLK